MQNIVIINGPNLDRLGKRQPEIYGFTTLSDVESLCRNSAKELGYGVEFLQSAFEGEIVNWIGSAGENSAGIVINAAAYTHTSYAILDALYAVSIPVVEVHISNIHKREAFRRHSVISPATCGMITGFGIAGYSYGIKAVADLVLAERNKKV